MMFDASQACFPELGQEKQQVGGSNFPVLVKVCRTSSPTHSERIGLGAIAITVTFRDVKTSTVEHFPWAVAHAAGIQFANAIIHIVAHPVVILIF